MKTLRAMPVLDVSDVRASAAFFARLGFDCHGFWGEDPVDFAIVQRGDVSIGLHFADGPVVKRRGWSVYIYVDDIVALHDEFRAWDWPPRRSAISPMAAAIST